jgi:hypothetical protein
MMTGPEGFGYINDAGPVFEGEGELKKSPSYMSVKKVLNNKH